MQTHDQTYSYVTLTNLSYGNSNRYEHRIPPPRGTTDAAKGTPYNRVLRSINRKATANAGSEIDPIITIQILRDLER